MFSPQRVVLDAAGNRYITDGSNQTIRKVSPDGAMSTLAGKSGESGSVDGPASAARFGFPLGLVLDGTGGMYITDVRVQTIRHIAADGRVSTVAGSPFQAGASNGVGSSARFDRPTDLAFDGTHLYIADSDNHVVRRLNVADGTVSTYAGVATQSGDAVASGSRLSVRFSSPQGLALAADGSLFVSDRGNCVIRRIAADVVTIVAGANRDCASADGPIATARLGSVIDIEIDGSGKLLFTEGTRLRRLDLAAGTITTLNEPAGAQSGHLDGPLATARFNVASGLAVEPQTGHLLVADSANHVIRRVDLTEEQVRTVIGQPPAVPSVDAFFEPRGLAFSNDGSLMVADDDRVQRLQADGTVSTIFDSNLVRGVHVVAEAPNGMVFVTHSGNTLRSLVPGAGGKGVTTQDIGVNGIGVIDGAANVAVFGDVRGIATDSKGQLIVADAAAHAIRLVTQAGTVSRLAGRYETSGSAFGDALDAALFAKPIDVAVAGNDDIFVLDAGNLAISRIAPGANGRATVTLVAGDFEDPRALAVDEAGNLYVAEGAKRVIVRIRPNGERSIVAGQPGVQGLLPGPLPGALPMPLDLNGDLPLAAQLGLKVRNNRLVMTTEKGVVQIQPLPQ